MPNGTTVFITEALRRFRTIGALLPSSRYLAQHMVKVIPRGYTGVVVELGGGSGTVTTAILAKLGPAGMVIVFEENKTLAAFLTQTIRDPRVVIIPSAAQTARDELRRRHVTQVEYVISGLPLGSIKKSDRFSILKTTQHILAPGGVYVQFQYFLASWATLKQHFTSVRIVHWELRNFPPAFIYQCRLAVV